MVQVHVVEWRAGGDQTIFSYKSNFVPKRDEEVVVNGSLFRVNRVRWNVENLDDSYVKLYVQRV